MSDEAVDPDQVQDLIPWHEAPGRLNSMPGTMGLRGRMSVLCSAKTGYKPLVIAEAYEGVWQVPVDAKGNVYVIREEIHE